MSLAAPVPVPRPARARLAGISLAYFMVLLDTTVLAVAEPTLVVALHTDVVGVGWAITIYTMTLASTLVLCGSLADRLGAYPVFLVGVVGFGAGSAACAVSPDLTVILVLRAFLGVFAAAIISSSLGLIASLYQDHGARARAISAWAAISGAAMATGPLVGGWLVALDGWRAVFVINLPVTLLVLLLCRAPIASPRHGGPLAWIPHLAVATTLATATLAIIEGGQRSWLSAALCGLTASACAYGTAMIDRASPAPVVPATLRRNRAVWRGFGWGAAANYGLTTVIFSVPLLLDASPERTGVILLPMTALVAFNPLVTGRLAAAFGPLLPIRIGFLAFLVGLALLAFATARDVSSAALGLGLLACGLGVSWTLPALVGYAVQHAEAEAAGAVGGILNATRQVGSTLAAAVASVALTQHRDGVAAVVPFLIAGAVCMLGLISAVAPSRLSAPRPTCQARRGTSRVLHGPTDNTR